MSSATAVKQPRVVSMDQYRGYTVAGMFLVNFVGHYAAFHYVLKHNSGFFSYADSIMPAFIFCAGFSYRLTAIRRFAEMGSADACWSYIRRSLALVMVSVAIFTFNADLGGSWSKSVEVVGLSGALSEFVFEFLKAGMWEVLSIIGVTQIILLPVINRDFKVRLIATIVFPLLHLLFSWSFNYDFANGLPNWFNNFFGAHNKTVWDGGLFGPLSWALPMLVGTLTYDIISARSSTKAFGPLMVISIAIMLGGYVTNCLTRIYDNNPAEQAMVDRAREPLAKRLEELKQEKEAFESEIQKLKEAEKDQLPSSELKSLKRKLHRTNDALKGVQRKIDSLKEIAVDPVIPSWERIQNASWGFADLPFVKPEREKQRVNYWQMDKKRMASLPFMLFATGFALFLYALFIVAVDGSGLQLGVFRTLGQNPLAAYIIHEMTLHAFHGLGPSDSPLYWGMLMFAVFFVTTYMMVRYLEKNKLFLRL